jgi:MFS family permease
MSLDQIRYKSFASTFFNIATISLGALWFGYSIGVFSLASDTIFKVFEVSESEKSSLNSLLTASVPFGAMIGSLLSGKLLDIFSRKNAFVVTDLIGIIATCFT